MTRATSCVRGHRRVLTPSDRSPAGGGRHPHPPARTRGHQERSSSCAPGYYCLFEFAGFNVNKPQGRVWMFKNSVYDLGATALDGNDSAQSAVNRVGEEIHLYEHYFFSNNGGNNGECLSWRPLDARFRERADTGSHRIR
ncbi:peptidase inhibitor family I36 protein [Streptomyces sp. 1114.5]|uniref:peptidase inhibitor family I36 protein n=1 Tax=Streptomyces sp. 1114.5 TaxID=1938830 RepID=UPI00211BC719|nr:peptidase inhibitor family I36 protein [Streptomyces sp. 1114.5]